MKKEFFKGEILEVNFNNKGCVLTGVHPAIFLGSFSNSTTCLVIPLTSSSKKKGHYNHVKILPSACNKLSKISYALVESIQCINKDDIKNTIGICSKTEYKSIINSINIFIK